MTGKCMFCGKPVDSSTPGSYREVRGWERVRSDGGANAITERQETGRVACRHCIDMRKVGINPAQGALI